MAVSVKQLQSDVFGVYKGQTRYLCDDPQIVKTGEVLSSVDTNNWFHYPMVSPWYFGYAVTKELKEIWRAEIIVRGSTDNSNWVEVGSFNIGSNINTSADVRLKPIGRDEFDTSTLYRYYSFYVKQSVHEKEDGTSVLDDSVAYLRVGIQAPV